MRAAVATSYGPPSVVRLEERPVPAVKNQEILVKNAITTVCAGDWRLRSLDLPRGFTLPFRLLMGWSGPRQPVLGVVSAGEVVAVGKRVSRFDVGDRVVCMDGMSLGGHAEYRAVSQNAGVAKIPESLSYTDAAALPFGGTTALAFLRDKARVKQGDRVCIVGSSGEVGAMAVQVAKHFGAHVTAVCSGANADLVRSIGADEVVDYTQAHYWDAEEPFDIVFDTVGASTYREAAPVLKPGGRFLMAVAGLYETLFASWMGRSGHTCIAGADSERAEVVAFLCKLAAEGELRPVIDQRVPFEDIVKAHERVDSHRKRGTLIVEFPSQEGDAAGAAASASGAAPGSAADASE